MFFICNVEVLDYLILSNDEQSPRKTRGHYFALFLKVLLKWSRFQHYKLQANNAFFYYVLLIFTVSASYVLF